MCGMTQLWHTSCHRILASKYCLLEVVSFFIGERLVITPWTLALLLSAMSDTVKSSSESGWFLLSPIPAIGRVISKVQWVYVGCPKIDVQKVDYKQLCLLHCWLAVSSLHWESCFLLSDYVQWWWRHLSVVVTVVHSWLYTSVFNDFMSGGIVLRIHISTPCWQLNRVEAVYHAIISCSEQCWFIIFGCVTAMTWGSQSGTAVGHSWYANNRLLKPSVALTSSYKSWS